MQGGVRKRGTSWYYYYEVGKVDGKRKRIERKGGTTKTEALKALREALTEFERAGTHVDESNMSVADYFDFYYKEYVLVNCKYNTQVNYRLIIDKHIKPALGIYKLKSLSPAVLQEFLNKKYLDGFVKNSVANFFGVLSGALRMAVYPYKYIKDNPMQYVTMPKSQGKKSTKEDLKIITIAQFNKIIERFPESSSFYIPVQIAFHTGMRAAEVCGLTWDCVDLENQTITVEKLIYKEEVWTFGTPKTESSERTITIGNTLTNILKIHKKNQIENRLKYGKYYASNTYEFKDRNKIYTSVDLLSTKENGELISTDSLKYLSRVVNYSLGIDYNFHSLRHTHATMMREAGADYKEIQERLGHSKLATTMDTYSHVTPKVKKDAVDKFEKYLATEIK